MLKITVFVCALYQIGAPTYCAKQIAPIIIKEATKRELKPSLVAAIVKHESRFYSQAKSQSDDYGLMQIHCPYPSYMWWCKDTKKLLKPRFNIKIGARVLQLKRKRCKKRKDWLSCYNTYSKGYAKRVRKIQHQIILSIASCKKRVP